MSARAPQCVLSECKRFAGAFDLQRYPSSPHSAAVHRAVAPGTACAFRRARNVCPSAMRSALAGGPFVAGGRSTCAGMAVMTIRRQIISIISAVKRCRNQKTFAKSL